MLTHKSWLADTMTRRQLLHVLGIGGSTFLLSPLLSGCAVDPVTGRQQFLMMSESEEIAIDQQSSPYQFSSDYGPVQDQRLNGYINRIGLELAARSHRPGMPFSFRAVNAAYINAYAFPGGSIAVTRGILVELENEAELAALLGHEIGHVCARHTAEQSSKGKLANIFVTGASLASSVAGFGAATDLIQGLGGLGAGALLASYSRDNEREADALGMEYMTRAGYSSTGMVGLMEILQRNGRQHPGAIELMFSTHPMSDERFQTAQAAAQNQYGNMQTAAFNRERFMEHTASLRRIRGAISALQEGDTLMRKKEFEAAREEFAKALQIAPDDYTAHVMMAKCQFALERYAEADSYAAKAAQIYPQEAQAHLLGGMTGIIRKKYSQAYGDLEAYDRLLPGNPEIAFFKGLSQEGMAHQQDSARFYREYLQKVRSGSKAEYAHGRLQAWGYIE